MTDYSYKNWASMSDHALAMQIGAFVRHHRLQQNKSQEELSRAAGISRSTLSLLEKGETVTLATLLQTLRALDQLQVMEAFLVPAPVVSPLLLARMERDARKRASGTRSNLRKESTW